MKLEAAAWGDKSTKFGPRGWVQAVACAVVPVLRRSATFDFWWVQDRLLLMILIAKNCHEFRFLAPKCERITFILKVRVPSP